MNVSPRAARQLQHFDQVTAAVILNDLEPRTFKSGIRIAEIMAGGLTYRAFVLTETGKLTVLLAVVGPLEEVA
jgi:hypothetical protein